MWRLLKCTGLIFSVAASGCLGAPHTHRIIFKDISPCDSGRYRVAVGGVNACSGMTVFSVPVYKTFYLRLGDRHRSLKAGRVLLAYNSRVDTFRYICTGDVIYRDSCRDSIYVLRLRMSDHYFYRKLKEVRLMIDSAVVSIAIGGSTDRVRNAISISAHRKASGRLTR